MAYQIIRKHDKGTDPKKLRLKFDALVSHDYIRRHYSDGARLGDDEIPGPVRHDELP